MREGQARQLRRRLALGVALLAALVLVGSVVLRDFRTGRVERAMNLFRAEPRNGEHAHRLVQWLANGSVTQAQGERILTLLLHPQITTRPAYPVGQPVKIRLKRPVHIEMPLGQIECIQEVWAAGRHISKWDQETNLLHSFPEIFTGRPATQEPGAYHGEIRIEGRIKHPARSPARWELLLLRLRQRISGRPVFRAPAPKQATYECHFIVPFDVNIVAPDRAERLELVANPQMDETMRAVFGAVARDETRTYRTAAGQRDYRGSLAITYKTLPLATVFELFLRLPDGREFPSNAAGQRQRIRLYGGTRGEYVVDVGRFGLAEPGVYSGTLVLRPDPDYAYEDPALKSIWNGTLEFPLSFTIDAGTPIQQNGSVPPPSGRE